MHLEVVTARVALHLLGEPSVSVAALVRQRFPPPKLGRRAPAIEIHVQWHIGILPTEQFACHGVEDVKLPVAEMVMPKASDLVYAIRGDSSTGVARANVNERVEDDPFGA